MNDITGMPQHVVVLGATSDIARAVLLELSLRRLEAAVLVARDEGRVEQVAAELRALGVRSEVVVADLSRAAGAKDLVAQSAAELGDIDLVLVAVGDLGTSDIDQLDADEVESSIRTNFAGPAAITLEFAKHLAAQGHGTIVVLSSVAAVRVRKSNFLYGATKAGLDGFALGLGDSLAGTGVVVVVVRPGFVHTKMTKGRPEAPFALEPRDVACALVQGLETGREVIWAPSALRWVFALLRVVPRVAWRRLPM